MSKLNPQNATAYVGPGVLRKGGKITPVPNGPLIKKKGPFKGSGLKSGGVIKKAVNGTTTTQTTTPVTKTWQQMSQGEKGAKKQSLIKEGGINRFNTYKDSISADAGKRANDAFVQNAVTRGLTVEQLREDNRRPNVPPPNPDKRGTGNDKPGCSGSQSKNTARLDAERNRRNGGPIKKSKSGGMIKRADGSTSKRGLWDNIRANKGSGKKPTKAMLVQEKKIKAKK